MGIVIGVTGGIATGKSTVCDMLQELGAFVIDVDALARDLVETDPMLQQLTARYGADIVNGGKLDRKRLAAVAFSSPEAARDLNAITHPEIIRSLRRQIDAAKHERAVVVNAPLLLEAGLEGEMDEVWVVTATSEQQVARAVLRGDCRCDVARRMEAQMNLKDKVLVADVVIDNSKELNDTRQQVVAQWQRVMNIPE